VTTFRETVVAPYLAPSCGQVVRPAAKLQH